ncbi:ctf8 domain-containing protein [Ditylenchus destructor]|uniref:Ctf8 domain-containing protein n=1 Tax=Ditylenchus destructor TaxID=166010 RepID=A0AAD4N3G6_9BILA|nr:ctf8 domain-containing protein [Ditylenchus destructor]
MQIKLLPNENGISEWMTIEMQGSFDFSDDMAGKAVGHLAWMNDGTISLIIGHQLMEGKISDLQRPFLVINKATLQNITKLSTGAIEDSEGSNMPLKGPSIKRCDIVGVIRRKIIFKDRPKPIVQRCENE